jgi:hypothetical protein
VEAKTNITVLFVSLKHESQSTKIAKPQQKQSTKIEKASTKTGWITNYIESP